jgi:hypothetical protein
MWDVAWYARTQRGEAFADLEQAFAEAAERGYNTIRISADPLLIYKEDGTRRAKAIRISNLGGAIGQRTRWYDFAGGATVDLEASLIALFEAAKRHSFFIIVSTWVYQQTLTLLDEPELAEEILAIPPGERFLALANAHSRLIDLLEERGLADRIAYVELHNEVEYSRLAEVAKPGQDYTTAEKPYLETAIAWLRQRHPKYLFTCAFGEQVPHRMHMLPDNVQVAHHHIYIYGVLAELERSVGLEPEFEPVPTGAPEAALAAGFPPDAARAMLRPGAPAFSEWQLPAGNEWKLEGNFLDTRLFYLHDWVDPDKWDLWLYEHYHLYRESMREGMRARLEAIADWAAERAVPAVIGEGWLGYTPLYADFEDGPVGKNICEYGIERALELGFWGVILGSNAAPHHPHWNDVSWQQRISRRVLSTRRP